MRFRSNLFFILILFSWIMIPTPARTQDDLRSVTETLILDLLRSPHERQLASEKRAKLMNDAARADSRTVWSLALPDFIVDKLDPSLMQDVEVFAEIKGYLQIVSAENLNSSSTITPVLRPNDSDERIYLHFLSPPRRLPVGYMVQARGLLLPSIGDGGTTSTRHMILESGRDIEVESPTPVVTPPSTVGRQRTRVLVVGFNDDLASEPDPAFGDDWDQLNTLLRRHSLGRAWLSFGKPIHVQLQIGRTCDTSVIWDNLGLKLQDIFDVSQYSRLLIMLPGLRCEWKTESMFPTAPTLVFVAGNPTTKSLFRAILHGFGVPGDHARSCDLDIIHGECRWKIDLESEYFHGLRAIRITSLQREQLGWMTGKNGFKFVKAVKRSDVYRVYSEDSRRATEKRLALKIKRAAPLFGHRTTYYLEYRSPRNKGGERRASEVVLYIVDGDRITDVLNLTSGDPVRAELSDVLRVSAGRFEDHGAGLQVEVVNASSSSVDLRISFDPTACVRAAPNIEVAPAETPYVSVENAARFSLVVTSRDSDACGPMNPSLHLEMPDGWSVLQGAPAPELEPGETAHVEVSTTIPPSETPGFRDLGWTIRGAALLEERRSAMLFVMPSEEGSSKDPRFQEAVELLDSVMADSCPDTITKMLSDARAVVGLTAAYEATGNAKYLDAALKKTMCFVNARGSCTSTGKTGICPLGFPQGQSTWPNANSVAEALSGPGYLLAFLAREGRNPNERAKIADVLRLSWNNVSTEGVSTVVIGRAAHLAYGLSAHTKDSSYESYMTRRLGDIRNTFTPGPEGGLLFACFTKPPSDNCASYISATGHTSVNVIDLGHGEVAAHAITLMYEEGEVITDADMRGLVQNFDAVAWNGELSNPRFSSWLDGTPGYGVISGKENMWLYMNGFVSWSRYHANLRTVFLNFAKANQDWKALPAGEKVAFAGQLVKAMADPRR